MKAAIAIGLLAALAPSLACAGENRWILAGREAVAASRALTAPRGTARNVVLFLGDGMGLTTVTAARIFEGQLRGEPGEENHLAFERFPHVALTKTYNTNQQTADSAGTMTAIVTGAKTRAGAISVDETVEIGDAAGVKGHRLWTLFEGAEERGLSTGIVTTTTVTHATPAACYAHSPDRSWEDDSRLSPAAAKLRFPDIARQLVEFPVGDGIDVVLGGGRTHFTPTDVPDPEFGERTGSRQDGRDLTRDWVERRPNGAYVWSATQLSALDFGATDHLLGLFEPSHMNFEVDRAKDPAGEPSLSEMTTAALRILSRNEKGFVLVVEGGRIDHGHHVGNAFRALVETVELSNAVRATLRSVDPDETLILVTADHGHVFMIGGYPTRGNPILGKVVENDRRGNPEKAFAEDGLGRPYTSVGYLNGPGYTGASDGEAEGSHTMKSFRTGFKPVTQGRPDLTRVDTAHPDYLQEAAVPMTMETHSGEDVPVYATGPGAELIHGVQEQSYLYHAVVEALGWNRESAMDAKPPGE